MSSGISKSLSRRGSSMPANSMNRHRPGFKSIDGMND